MRTSSQFRQKLERLFGIAFGAHRHDQAISTGRVRLCKNPLRISSERRIDQPLARAQLVQQVRSHQRLGAICGAFALAQLGEAGGKGCSWRHPLIGKRGRKADRAWMIASDE
jgi:hypothetical protein